MRVHVGLQPVADGEQQPDSNPVDPVEEILQPAADGEQQTDSVPAEPVEETLQPGADGEQQTHSVPVESVEETLQPGADGEQQTDSVPVESVEDAPGEQGETPLVGGQRLTSSLLKQVMAEAIRGEDVEKVTFKMLMEKLADLLGVDVEELQGCKERIRGFVDKIVRKEVSRQILDKVTQQSKHKKQKVEPVTKAIGSAQVLMAYLLTWSHPKQPSEERKSPEAFTRENLRDILLSSFIASQAEVADSRQAAIALMAIFEERHQSGLKHFHVAVRLSQATRWGPWRKVLQEEHSIYMDFSTCSEGRKQQRSNSKSIRLSDSACFM